MTDQVTKTVARTDEADSLSVAITQALAEVEGVRPDELDLSIYEYVDTSALEAFFDSPASPRARCGRLSFPVRNHVVVVDVDRDDTAEVSVFADAADPEEGLPADGAIPSRRKSRLDA
ncbi:MAG: HalOD1 output domain-containing protein [Halobacteriaceae archaeon]